MLFDNFDDPKNAGLLSAAAQMLAMSGPSRTPTSFGQILGSGLLGGMQGYQQAEEGGFMRDYRKSQMEQVKSKTAATKAQQEALARVAQGYQLDPNFKPSMGDLLAIDPDSAIKGMMPGSGMEFALDPKIGVNPETGKTGYFIQDKGGNTKWLGAGVPDKFTLIPGTDYQPPQKFDSRSGAVYPITPGATGPRAPGAPAAPPAGLAPAGLGEAPALQVPEIDPFAPWNRITSPKEQDEFKKRVYEQDNKRLDDLREAVRKGRSVMTDLNRFGQLNREQGTGSFLDNRSWMPTTDEEKLEMLAISSRLAPAQRPEGSGSSSNLDVNMFLQSLPGIDKPGNVNKAIREQYAKQLEDGEKQLAFREQYLTDRGHLSGVSNAFADAVENGKTGGLDVSKLTQEQIAFLQQQNSDAFGRGVARFQKNGGSPSAPAQNKSLLAQLPTPNRSNMGKVAIDHETGKRYKSNGMQWVEVQ